MQWKLRWKSIPLGAFASHHQSIFWPTAGRHCDDWDYPHLQLMNMFINLKINYVNIILFYFKSFIMLFILELLEVLNGEWSNQIIPCKNSNDNGLLWLHCYIEEMKWHTCDSLNGNSKITLNIAFIIDYSCFMYKWNRIY